MEDEQEESLSEATDLGGEESPKNWPSRANASLARRAKSM
jgi:hypothetical protein